MGKKKDSVAYRDRKDLTVLTAAELMSVSSLAERVERMTENRFAVFVHNLEWLCKTHDLKQARLCEDQLQSMISPAQLSGFKQVGKDIPLRVISLVSAAFGYTVEQMTGQLLDQEEAKTRVGDKAPPRPYEEYIGFLGTYEMAYFTDSESGTKLQATNAYLGKGLMTVYMAAAADGVPVLKVAALLDCQREELLTLLERLHSAESQGSSRGIVCVYDKAAENAMRRYYTGQLLLSEAAATIDLQQQLGKDRLTITLRNRAGLGSSDQPYAGGLGTQCHSCIGESRIPRVQAVALSKKGFGGLPKETLAQHLLMAPVGVELHREAADILGYVRMMDKPPLADLPEEDKQFLVESLVKRKLSLALKRSAFATYNLTAEQDRLVYKACC